MTDSPPPPELLAWVAGHLPGPVTVADCSWPRATSQVWRIDAGGSAAFVKISPDDEAFAREVIGYDYAAKVLTTGQAPRQLASEPRLRAILTSALPGRVVRDLPLPVDAELRLHEDAGRLLRRWHNGSAPGTGAHRATVRDAMSAYAREAAEIPGLAEQLPLLFLHGDYGTRNWLVDTETGRHGLIDFEQSRYGLVVEEFVWLLGALWPERPDLRTAFFTGYGRLLDRAEERLLVLLTARLGASYLHTGLRKGREDLQARGHLALAHTAAHPTRT